MLMKKMKKIKRNENNKEALEKILDIDIYFDNKDLRAGIIFTC